MFQLLFIPEFNPHYRGKVAGQSLSTHLSSNIVVSFEVTDNQIDIQRAETLNVFLLHFKTAP
jgi:hypothetical protein